MTRSRPFEDARSESGTLEDHFRTQIPPSRGLEIIGFWEALFRLLDQLKEIHSSGTVHLSIKPENIRAVSDAVEHPQFKFADPRVLGSGERENGGEGSDYDPPEFDPSTRISPSRGSGAADIWALGCIYSEAAIWIADGYAGLQNYRYQRQMETNRLSGNNSSKFHDGERVLQCVLDAHGDIEDRLRRSDNTTKNVLDSMVQEMLWEEDRPSAKALLRKADVLLNRARQKSGVSSVDAFTRPGTSQSRQYLPPPYASPTRPLPPVPQRAAPGLNSIPGRTQNLDKVAIPQFRPKPRAAVLSAPKFPSTEQNYIEDASDSDRERDVVKSIASWNISDKALPHTPLEMPQTNVNYSHHKQTPNQGRPRALRSQDLQERKKHPVPTQHHVYPKESYLQDNIPQRIDFPQPELKRDAPSIKSRTSHLTSESEAVSSKLGRASSLASSHHSSLYSRSQPTIHSPTTQNDSFLDALSYIPTADEISETPTSKPNKRIGGFLLFPTRSRNEASSHQSRVHDVSVPPIPQVTAQNLEYISLNTCLEWKRANKKVKKQANVPPLLSPGVMEELSERDHAFIIDDSESMAPVWLDVQRVFEALSYTVKGMSPEGTELFFTISYADLTLLVYHPDATYLRKDTTDLSTHLATHPLKGQTNILYRLNLQLQAYRLKLLRAKTPPKTKTKSKKAPSQPFVPEKVRPLSIYVLTNGEWGGDGVGDGGVEEVMDAMRVMGTFSESEGLDSRQVCVQFVSFAGSAAAMKRMGGLVREHGEGGVAVDCERWTGNVLRMLRGALDTSGDDDENGMVAELP
ncbi:hypothetical protein BKA61DRAFT_714272 [Leptodontidium sp. MPI-SDFR-AT-0119]|nr:hypothetical protein BKA61DRAFT_714272 [Leptodontidium sp. MPI-SDFR-AT-0119]